MAGEERLVGLDFSLPQLRKRQAISSHISLTRAMAPPNCRSRWEEYSSICPEGEERQLLVSTSHVYQGDLESGLQAEGADVVGDIAGGACRESWKSSSQPHSSGFERALEVSQIWTKFLATLGYPDSVSF